MVTRLSFHVAKNISGIFLTSLKTKSLGRIFQRRTDDCNSLIIVDLNEFLNHFGKFPVKIDRENARS